MEYQQDPLSLKKFYPNVLASPSQISTHIPEVLANYRTDRDELLKVLNQINTDIDAGEKTFENIEMLRQSDSVAIVTGQQAGLFSGPLYTIYKALSAVKLATDVNNAGGKAVPVFWAASEDHDFEEVSEAFFINSTGAIVGSKYALSERTDGTPVGFSVIDSEICKLIAQLFDQLPRTEFSEIIREKFGSIWSEGAKFGEAFGGTLAWILRNFGIVYVDPVHAGIKRLASPIFEKAVEKTDEIVATVVARSRELVDQGYHAQVLVEDEYFPLFWHDDEGRRLALRKISGDYFKVKDGRQEFSADELRQIAVNEPDRFSPGVMLRPVVQDYLFPTACYFGGGAEIAYFAQNSEVYRVLGRPVTPIFHRQSFTIIESKQRRVFAKFGLDLAGLFDGKESTILKLAATSVSPDTDRVFAEVAERITAEMDRIDQAVSLIEPTLAANVARRRQKIAYHIAALRKKSLLAQVRNDEIASRQIDELFAALLPHGELQERTLNVFSFLNKYGLNFIDWIYDAIDLEDKDHRIIEL